MALSRKDRQAFYANCERHGISTYSAGRLLRYAATLHRLATAQCNGEYPYANGAPWTDGMSDKAKARKLAGCERCGEKSNREEWAVSRMSKGSVCGTCTGKRGAYTGTVMSPKWVPCDACRGRGHMMVCPDCKTTENAKAFVQNMETLNLRRAPTDPRGPAHMQGQWVAMFQGDPRGCVFRLHQGKMAKGCEDDNCTHYKLGVPAW